MIFYDLLQGYIRNGLYVKYFALQNDIIYDTLFRFDW